MLVWVQATRVSTEEDARRLELELKDEFGRLLAKATADKESKLLMDEELLSFIDNIERLGVAYRFHLEIEEALHTIFTSYSTALQTAANESCDEDLHRTSLRFRLLRQHGFHVPSGIDLLTIKFINNVY